MSRRERRTSGARKSSADDSAYLSPRDRKKAPSNADSDDNTPMRGSRQKTPSSADQKKPAKKAAIIEEEEDGVIDDRSIKKKSKKTTPVGKLKKSAESEKKEKLIADDGDGEMDDDDIAGGRKAATGTNSSSSASASKPAVRTGLDIELLNQLLRGVPDNFFRKDNFNPFNHWNDDRNKLSEWRAQTERAVDHIIDIYFKGFNMSISSFSSVLKSFSASQSLTNDLSDALVKSKRYLQNTNLSLRELWGATVTAKKVVEICDKVEYIRSVPSQFDSYVRKKQFLHSVRLLSSAIFLLTGEDLCEIEGLKEIREELLMKRNELQALLMEEIINIIYLKGLKNRLDGKNFREEDDDELLLSVQRKRGHSSRESSLRESPANSFKEVSNASFSSFTSNKNLSATPHNSAGVGIISRGSFSRRSVRGDSSTPSNSSMGGMGSVGGHSWRPEESQFSPFSVKKDNNDRGSSNSFSSSPSLRLSYSDSRSNSLINDLLIEEKSDSYLHHPTGNTSRFLCLCTEALNEMNAIPALRTQIWKRMRGEIKELIDNQAARIKEKAEKLKARRRVLGQTDSYQGGGSSSPPSTPMLSSTQSAYEKEDADLLLELFDSIFQLLTGVLKSHIEVSSLITSRLGQGMDEKEKKETILATTPPGASGFMKGSGSGASEVTAVWEVMQIQLQVLFCDYLQARGETINVNNSAAKARRKAGLAALEELSFSFEENSIPSIAKMSRNVKKEELKRRGVFIDPSESSPTSTVVSSSSISFLNGTPYNITQIYRPVIQFIDQAVSMIGASQSSAIGMLSSSPSSSSEVQLRQFLKVFIETSFLPRVQADVNRRLDEILNDTTAFDPREIERDQRNQLGALSSLSSSSSNPSSIDNDIQLSSQLLLKSVQEVADLLKRLFSDMLLLPHSVNEYVAIVERLVMRTAEKCSERVNDLTKKTFSAQRLADPKVYSLLQSDPLFKCLTNADWKNAYEDPKVDSFFSDANPLYNEFYKKEWILKKDQLLFDPKSIGALALICESMEWMADKLFQLTDPFYGASSASKRYANPPRALFAQRSGRGGAAVNQSSNNARFGSFRWVSRNNDRFGPSRLASKSLLEQKRYGLAESFLQLADRCLFILRFELHSHYFYFLKEMLHGQYFCANDSMEPEGWVLDFNKDLTLFDDALTKYLSSDKKKYVLGGSFPLISSIIIRSIPLLHDRRVNKKGVAKLTRNCFALQQNLTNILFSQEYTGAAHFDRARQYLELLNYSDEDLHLFQLDNPDMFSQEEYIAIQSIHTPIRLANTINHTQTN